MQIPLGLCLIVGVLIGAGALVMPARLILPVGAALLSFSGVLFAFIGDWDIYLRVGALLLGAVPGWTLRAVYDAVWLELDKHDDNQAAAMQAAITPRGADRDRPQAWRALPAIVLDTAITRLLSQYSPRGYAGLRRHIDNDDPRQRRAAQPLQPPGRDAPADADDRPAHRQHARAGGEQPGGRAANLPPNVMWPPEDDREFNHDLLDPDAAPDPAAAAAADDPDAAPDRGEQPPAHNDAMHAGHDRAPAPEPDPAPDNTPDRNQDRDRDRDQNREQGRGGDGYRRRRDNGPDDRPWDGLFGPHYRKENHGRDREEVLAEHQDDDQDDADQPPADQPPAAEFPDDALLDEDDVAWAWRDDADT